MMIDQNERDLYCLKSSGYIIHPNFLSEERVDVLYKKLQLFEVEVAKVESTIKNRIGFRHGWPLLTTRCLYCISDEIQEIAMSEEIQKIAQNYLSGAVIRDCALQTNMPDTDNRKKENSGKLSFHRDTLWLNEEIVPNYLHAFILLTDFTSENGATFVVPGSHLLKEPNYYFKHSDPGVREFGIDYLVYNRSYFPSAIQLIAAKGTLIFLDPMVIHSQGNNITLNKRSLLNISFRRKNIFGNPPLLNGKKIAKKYSRVKIREDFLSLLESDETLVDFYGPFFDNSENNLSEVDHLWEKRYNSLK